MHALIKSVAVAAAISSVVAIESAHAGLTLTPTGVGLGFSLSTYYTDPAVSYGMLQATTAPDGSVIATGYGRNQIVKAPDVDGQTFGSLSLTAPSIGSAYGMASVGGKVYFSSGFGSGGYYTVNTTTLALTPLALSTPTSPYLGLWANQVTGHLLSSSYSGLVDIDPITGAVVVVGAFGADGVTVSSDGKTGYAEIGGHILGYNLVVPNAAVPVFDSGVLPGGPDGTGMISGGALNGQIVVDNNDGTLLLLDPVTNTYVTIASGGTRGDFVGPDLTNGTLFVSTSDIMYRLGVAGGSIGGGPIGPAGVPEPMTLALFGIGLAGLMLFRLRDRKFNPING